MHRIIKIMVPLILLTITAGCGVKITYKFTGASIPVEAKTISVTTFQNRASHVVPGLAQTVTDALIDMCRAQTNLDMVSSGDNLNLRERLLTTKHNR